MTKLRVKVNRTNKYLWPCVNLFGSTFLRELEQLTNYVPGYQIGHSILSTSIADILYYRAKEFQIQELLFVIFDTRGCYREDKQMYLNVEKGKEKFKNFLKYVRTNKHYHDDYWFGTSQYCIVFDLKSLSDTYWNFFCSSYSRMYNKGQLKTIGITKKQMIQGKEGYNPVYAVLTGEKEVGTVVLKSKIYEYFGTEDLPEEPAEYDIPWYMEEELLNYKYINKNEIENVRSVKYKRYEILQC